MHLNHLACAFIASIGLSLIVGVSSTAVAADAPAVAAPKGELTPDAHPEIKERLFELRTYTAAPGKLDALHKRFREHTNALFVKHGMTIIGYWTPTDEPRSKDTLIYILAYPDREAREKSWKEFQADPDWQKAKGESEKDGPILTHAPDFVFMSPTDFSPMK